MALNSNERAVLFCTESIQLQMVRFLSQKKCSTVSEMREVWSDISKGLFLSSLIALQTRGVVSIKEDKVKLASTKPERGEISEAVWRAARLRKTFSINQIAEDLPKYTNDQISHVLKDLVKAKGIAKIGKTKSAINKQVNVYQVIKDTPVKPVLRKQKKIAKADLVWDICQSLEGGFTWRDILSRTGSQISKSYIRDLFTIWQQDGLLAVKPDKGTAFVYFVVGDQRSVVRKNNKKWAESLMGTSDIKEKRNE